MGERKHMDACPERGTHLSDPKIYESPRSTSKLSYVSTKDSMFFHILGGSQVCLNLEGACSEIVASYKARLM